jgi:hypothetical protein
MSVEVMKQALEALDHEANKGNDNAYQCERDALRTAIEQAEKPVCDKDPRGCWSVRCQLEKKCKNTPPVAPREWVELTDDEARALVNRATFGDKTNWQALVYIVDAKLKEKNHG